MSETDLCAAIVDTLNALGCTVWKNNAGCRGGVRMAPKGSPDVIGFTRWRRFLGIEVKLPGGKLSKEQLLWQDRMGICHCLYGVARSVEDAVAIAQMRPAREAEWLAKIDAVLP